MPVKAGEAEVHADEVAGTLGRGRERRRGDGAGPPGIGLPRGLPALQTPGGTAREDTPALLPAFSPFLVQVGREPHADWVVPTRCQAPC